ncbi:AMP-binding protein [Nocardia farcinica]|uniref:AMP-binding protein n=1 Tax=Nocardia farcinica TaxID=37329 RepID=UPI0024541470|nr:AMP-binding protein [Nocardia farcinica]
MCCSPNSSEFSFGNWNELLRVRASEKSDDIAFVFLDDAGRQAQALDYGDLHRRAEAFAARLTRDFKLGDRVLLLHPPGLDYVVSFYACLYAGLVAVPLFPPQRNRVNHVEAVARDCAAAAVVSTPEVLAEMANLSGDLFVSRLPRVSTEYTDDLPVEFEPPEIDGSQIAYLQYTSGSTSTPKGVIIDHAMALQQVRELAFSWEVDATSVVVSWLPHFHDFGQVSSVLMPVYVGGGAVLMAPSTFVKNPFRWLAAVTEYRGTHSGAPNFAFDLCVDKITPAERAELDLASWRLVSNGAEPVRLGTLERFEKTFAPHGLAPTALSPGYGLAEATLKVCSGTPDRRYRTVRLDDAALGRRKIVPSTAEHGSTELVGCGGTVLETEVAIVEPETGRRVGDDELGEIWVSGPIVAPGYWNRPEDSEQTFRARIVGDDSGRTYLRTGDLGFVHEGELFICGRVKNLMIVNGVNYYLEDLEATVVGSDEALRAGAVIAFSVERDGQENLVLVAEYRPDTTRAPEELVTVMHTAVSRKHAVAPAAIVLIAAGTIPRTTSGKLRRQQCKADFLAGSLQEIHRWEGMVTITEETTGGAAPAGGGMPSMRELVRQGLATQVSEWITANLGAEAGRVRTSRSLIENGFGSVDQMDLHERLETWSGKRFPPELMWDAPSIDEMVEVIAGFLVPGGAEPAATPTEDPTGVGAQ